VPAYQRDGLAPGSFIAGPAVIVEDETTTIVPLAFVARIDPLGAIVLERKRT
jgi:N-methylhydantoinase A